MGIRFTLASAAIATVSAVSALAQERFYLVVELTIVGCGDNYYGVLSPIAPPQVTGFPEYQICQADQMDEDSRNRFSWLAGAPAHLNGRNAEDIRTQFVLRMGISVSQTEIDKIRIDGANEAAVLREEIGILRAQMNALAAHIARLPLDLATDPNFRHSLQE